MPRPTETGLTVWEILICLFVAFVVLSLSLPASPGGLRKASMTQTLSNARQLYTATQAMVTDGVAIGNTNLGWPGDTGGSFARWAATLVGEGYLTTNDFFKLLTAPGVRTPREIPMLNTNALLLYAARADSSSNAVFLTTANFTNTPQGGLPLSPNAKPYGDKGFVVFRKGGDGTVYKRNQVGQTNIIGSYVPLCK